MTSAFKPPHTRTHTYTHMHTQVHTCTEACTHSGRLFLRGPVCLPPLGVSLVPCGSLFWSRSAPALGRWRRWHRSGPGPLAASLRGGSAQAGAVSPSAWSAGEYLIFWPVAASLCQLQAQNILHPIPEA